MLHNILLYTCLILEFLLVVILPAQGVSQEITSFGQFFCGIGLGIILIHKFYNRTVETVKVNDKKFSIYIPLGISVVFLLALWPLKLQLGNIFVGYPIDANISDIIPTIRVAVERFMSGEQVYKEVHFKEGWSLASVGYLPMQWLPFCLADILKKDYRYIAFAIWTLSILLLIFRSTKNRMFDGIVIATLSLSMLWLLIIYQRTLLGTTVELLIAGYYVFLIIGLNQKNPYLKAAVIVLCMLSRYSLVLWLPLWLLVEWFSGDRKAAIISCLTITAAVLIIYIIPFLSQDWGTFFRVFKNYDKAALGEWQHISTATGKPYHLYNGSGFAYLYYEYLNWEMPLRIKALQRSHLILSLLSVALCGLWYFVNRKRIKVYKIFLLGSFKIYLTFFLLFIQVPYTYLIIVGCFVSLAIVAEQSKYRLKEL
jgi:hypothetical protein